MLQAFAGIAVGFIVLASQGADKVAGTGKWYTREALADYLNHQVNAGYLQIEINGKASNIPYTEFDVSVDIDKTFEALQKDLPQNGLEQFFSAENDDGVLKPVFTYNSGKLQKNLESLFSSFEKEPVPESYEIKDGALMFIPQMPGTKVDYAQLELELSRKVFSESGEPYKVNTEAWPLLLETKAEGRYPEPFATLVSMAEIKLESGYEEKAISHLELLMGSVFDNNEELSLKKLMDFSKFSNDIDKDLLNRIATALYQSAIKLEGVKVLNRVPAPRPVSYTEPGLEAVIEGEGADLLMRNETGKPLMVLFETKPDALSFYIASTGEIKSGTLVVQKKDHVPPPVITSVNKTLSVNETKVVSEGVPGFTASVSRVIGDDQVELYTDKYKPVSRIIETGEKPLNTIDK